MIYSDLYINKTAKAEILPTDSFTQEINVLEKGDRLISIFRPIGNNAVMNSIKRYFAEEFAGNYKISEDKNTAEILMETIEAFGNSLVNPPADFTLDGEVELLIVYESPKNEIFVAKVGSIQFKQKINHRFKSTIEDSNPLSARPDTKIHVRCL